MMNDVDVTLFQENGYLVVRQLFTPEEMEEAKQAAKALVETKAGPSGVFVWKADVIPEVFDRVACHPALVDVLRRLIGPEIEFLSAKPVFKSGNVKFASPWHQDYAYWGGATKYSVWIALEEATPENGCLKVIPGSHRNVLDHASIKDIKGFGNRIMDSELEDANGVEAPMQTGDALVFHDCLLHSSFPNTSGRERWSFIPTYRDRSVRDESKAWATSKVLGET